MALTDSLISYWKLDEASGTRVDSHSTNDLTDNNTVGSATGKINDAADFEKDNSEYLSRTSNASLQTGDIDYTISCWVYPETQPASSNYYMIVGKDGSAGGQREFNLNMNGDSTYGAGGFLGFVVFHTDSTVTEAAIYPQIPTATWSHIVAWHDAAANQIGICVNNGTPVTASTSGALQAASNSFWGIGAREYGGFPSYYDGLIDEVGFWKRVLTSGERTDLYNGGSGLAYSSFGAGSLVVTPFRNRLMSPGHIFGGKCLC